MRFFKAFQQLQRPVVIRTRPYLTVNTRYVFQVMVEHIWWRCSQNIQSTIHTTAEIRHQSFNFDLRAFFPNGSNAIRKVLGTAIAQVITVNGGDNHITQRHIGNGLRQFHWFIGIRSYRATVGNVTERTTAGTNSAEDHKRCCAVVEAFRQVRAGGFLADRMQAIFAHCGFDALDTCRVRWKLDFHPFRLAQQGFALCCHVFNRDKGHLIGIAVFNTAFHHNGFTHSVRVPVANYEGKRFNSIDCCNYQLFLN